MSQNENTPPKVVLSFFRWFCKEEFQEEIEGDLIERFHFDVESYGHKKAKWLLTKEVLKLFRPTIIGNIFQLKHNKSTMNTMQNKRLFLILAAVPALLLIPFIAMQFSNSVDWKMLDFIVMGVLLAGTGLLIELVLRRVKHTKDRLLICGAVLLIFLLVWAELAVGIFGTPIAGS